MNAGLWLSGFVQIALAFCNVLKRLSMLIQTMCRAFHATPAMDTHASFVHNAGKAGTQHTKPTLLYAFAELRDLAALQHRKIQTQSIALINLQKRTQALVDSTADLQCSWSSSSATWTLLTSAKRPQGLSPALCVLQPKQLSLHFGMIVHQCCWSHM